MMTLGRKEKCYCFFRMMVFVGAVALIISLEFILKTERKPIVSSDVVQRPTWGYLCENNICKKVELATNSSCSSLSVCRLLCGEDVGTLWPKPTGDVSISKTLIQINPNGIDFGESSFKWQPYYWLAAMQRFSEMNQKQLPNYPIKAGGKSLIIEIITDSDDMSFTLETPEGYKLEVSEQQGRIHALVTANNFYGARNGLETLSQLIVYDNIRNEMLIIGAVSITDEPKFKYRGILLDTSRNFFSVASIKRTIEGMAMVKLNTFHWHITDSHSFPFVVKSQPELSKLGAYSPEKIYSSSDIEEVVQFGKVRGVRVLPEFDAPAHIGEGWQKKDLTTCFKAQPWKEYCVEPPCGQLDPSKDEVYNVLEDIYRELVEDFQHPNLFHMGGDEVSVDCWNSSETLQDWMLGRGWNLTEDDFMELWGHFQENALERMDKVNDQKVPIIMWTSRLTEEPFLTKYLDKDRYIIQIWTVGDDPKIQTLLENGYKLIVSNYDALYLDCGFGGWVTDGNNWCSPYIGWQKVYDNRMEAIAGSFLDQILGAEATMFTEQTDEWSLDSRIWPRASALAERLWSNPQTSWNNAESRMLVNRLRLVNIGGIAAERLQPEWCFQNEGDCPLSV